MARREGQTAEQEAEAIASIDSELRRLVGRIERELGADPAFTDALTGLMNAQRGLHDYLIKAAGG